MVGGERERERETKEERRGGALPIDDEFRLRHVEDVMKASEPNEEYSSFLGRYDRARVVL